MLLGYRLSALAWLGVLTSCLPINDGSTLTGRDGLVDCRNLRMDLYDSQDNKLPKTRQYMSDIANFIMRANPETFTGDYAAEKFCFGTNVSNVWNAFAVIAGRFVVFNTAVFKDEASDLSLAAVMAHELAHISKRHHSPLSYADFAKLRQTSWNVDLDEFRRVERELLQSQEQAYRAFEAYVAYLSELAESGGNERNLVSRYRAAVDVLSDNAFMEDVDPASFNQYFAQIRQIQSELFSYIGPERAEKLRGVVDDLTQSEVKLGQARTEFRIFRDAISQHAQSQIDLHEARNGREREADEYGLRYYLRAGLDPRGFSQFQQTLLDDWYSGFYAQDQPRPFWRCLNALIQARRLIPERGIDSHPSPCWRWWNTSLMTPLRQASEFLPMMEQAKQQQIATRYSLAEVRQEIEAYEAHQQANASTDSQQSILRPSELDEQSVCASLGGVWRGATGDGYCELPFESPELEVIH